MSPLEYEARKISGRCTRCGEPASDDSTLCEAHRADLAARVARTRAKRRRAGKCPRCGRHRIKPGAYACSACLTYLGRFKTRRGRPKQSDVTKNVTTDGDLIASRTRVHSDGRTRYHGQESRGRQPLIQLDAESSRNAQSCLSRGLEALGFYWSAEVQASSRTQAAEVRAEALAYYERAQRWIDEVLARNGVRRSIDDGAE